MKQKKRLTDELPHFPLLLMFPNSTFKFKTGVLKGDLSEIKLVHSFQRFLDPDPNLILEVWCTNCCTGEVCWPGW